jgi:hypothetical protein
VRAQQRLEAERRRRLEEARKQRLVARATFQTRPINPFDVFDIQPARPGAAERCTRTLSPAQRGVLLKQGIDPDHLSYPDAKKVIAEIFRRWELGLCTPKQARRLKLYGYETANLSKAEATRLLGRIAANGWRVPAEIAPRSETIAAAAAGAGVATGGDWL